jgi:hypothetical protein
MVDERAECALVEGWVRQAVRDAQVVDVHTHLFPAQHGELCLWGIDALLTYHYLVTQCLATLPASVMTPQRFFELGRSEQADLVWRRLFVESSPLSEACRGVLTTLQRLGLGAELAARDLPAIRAWFARQDPARHVERVFEMARVRYAVMTNIPTDAREVAAWALPDAPGPHARFKGAVRVDAILQGDWAALRAGMAAARPGAALPRAPYEAAVEGARNFLSDWCARIDAVYLMASTPAGFRYLPELKRAYRSDLVLEYQDALADEEVPEGARATELIDKVLIPVAHERRLALALKVGAKRGLNPELNRCGGGDGVETTNLDFIADLARMNPLLKLLVTVLSRDNQHELAVTASRFRNVHAYGVWWYCNSPSSE